MDINYNIINKFIKHQQGNNKDYVVQHYNTDKKSLTIFRFYGESTDLAIILAPTPCGPLSDNLILDTLDYEKMVHTSKYNNNVEVRLVGSYSDTYETPGYYFRTQFIKTNAKGVLRLWQQKLRQ